MHLVYLDESGDPGLTRSPGHHYIIAGFAIHHSHWHSFDRRLREFRSWAQETYGLQDDHELHAAEFLGSARVHCGVSRDQRLLIIRRLIHLLEDSPELRFFGWVADKHQGPPLQRTGKKCLIDLERWSTSGDLGGAGPFLIIHDQMPTMPSAWVMHSSDQLVGRPLSLPSDQSRQLQVADLVAYLIKQSRYPSRYLKEQGAHQMIKRLTERSLGWLDA